MAAKTNSESTDELTTGMLRGIELLMEAYVYAEEVQRDHWDFAVEIQSLHAAGTNNAELRWLVCKGLATHAEEEAARTKPDRVFRSVGETTFRKRSCFVLTKTGFAVYESLRPQNLANVRRNK